LKGARAQVIVAGLTAAALALLAGFMVWRATRPPPLPVYWSAPAFALVDQNGDTLQSADLRESIWLASFIFTHCTDFCPRVTQEMARLRDSLRAQGRLGRTVRLLSFSVDPARDTPDVLRAYAATFGGSPASEWAFLTGTPPERVLRMIEEGFHLTARTLPAGPADTIAGYQVMHSMRIALVDRQGRVRGTYQATETAALESLRADLRGLVQEGS
jgi:cytochrome oxidase Cu insertion factor (SCO1/SenC/PrrC family)